MSKSKMAFVQYKMWRAKPPGDEQKELDRMFASREIDVGDGPESIRQSSEIFKQFSPKVFAAHFRTSKAKHGLCANALENAANNQHPIPELRPINVPPPSPNDGLAATNEICVFDVQNAPVSVWQYTDHSKKNDYVCVALPIISGCRNVTPKLSEDGTKLIVTYIWPKAIFQAKTLFPAEITSKELTLQHPKVHSFVSNLIDSRITENSSPMSQTTIALPCKVKREIGSYERKAMKVDGTNVLMMQFTAYQKSLLVDEADDSLNFD